MSGWTRWTWEYVQLFKQYVVYYWLFDAARLRLGTQVSSLHNLGGRYFTSSYNFCESLHLLMLIPI